MTIRMNIQNKNACSFCIGKRHTFYFIDYLYTMSSSKNTQQQIGIVDVLSANLA